MVGVLVLAGGLEACADVEEVTHPTQQADAGPVQAIDGKGDRAALADGAALPSLVLSEAGTDARDAQVAPSVISVTPGDKNVDVGRSGKVIVQFSDEMDETSLESGGLTILLGTERVEGTIRADGRYATFDPDSPWNVAGKYTVVVSAAAKNTQGAPLSTEWRGSFWVRDGIWSAPATFLEGLSDSPTAMSFEMDAVGNGMLVWIATAASTGRSTLRAARYEKGEGWGEPVRFETRPRTGESVSLSVSPSGQAVIGWITDEAAVDCAWYDADSDSWSIITEVRAEEDVGVAQNARAFMNPSGRGLLAWSRPNELWVLPVRADMDWDQVPYRLAVTGTVMGPPWAALRSSMDGMLVWGEDDGAGASALRYSRYWRRGDTAVLSKPALVPSGASGVELGDSRRIAVDAVGSGVLVWEKDLGDRSEVWAGAFSKDGAWGGAEELDSLPGYARNPALAVAPSGAAVAVWAHLTAPDRLTARVRSSTYSPSAGWEAPATMAKWVANDPIRVPTSPRVTLDRNGNGFVTWDSPASLAVDDQNHWVIARYLRGDFLTSKKLDRSSVDASHAALATGANGETLAVWFECDAGHGCVGRYSAFQ